MVAEGRTRINIRKGDRVIVLAGKDKGREGKVLSVDKKKNRVVVEGLNMVHKHIKPGKNMAYQQGGIIRVEAPIHASNVMYVHKGKPTRIGFLITEKTVDGKTVKIKQRVARTTGEVID